MTHRGTLLQFLLGLGCSALAATSLAQSPDLHQAKAIELLGTAPTGQLLLQKARNFWGLKDNAALASRLVWGAASRTDAVLIRHLDPVSGKERREREVTVYLNKDQSLEELTLDIAHELVHATSRPSWDPYDPSLTAGKYIWNTIEGDGGEVEAVVTECQVGAELKPLAKLYRQRCESYRDPKTRQISRSRIRQDFYRVGKWNETLQRDLGTEIVLFPLLSKTAPTLFSSTGRAPYPAALLQEYRDLTQSACENSQKRYEALRRPAGQGAPSRGLASEPRPTERATMDFISQRCRPRTF